ncbi:PLP-dependent transferase [Hortaea werneckii]|nr:PLP-dependent transferase [Hortaea werneckii]KAI7107978.1 PLP-dependent transferase [Hortaea werneckii]KAI7238142.1 PLP-dependent transferase [Hortaea werneckii]
MVKIDKFAVEEWMAVYQAVCKYDISETCCASISLSQLEDLCEDKSRRIFDPDRQLIYGPVRGSQALRDSIASLYHNWGASASVTANDVLVATGAIGSNHLTLYSLLQPGDHVIVHHPTYQQLYAVPASLGADVDLWKASPQQSWIPSIEELKTMIKPNTKMIIINNPNNPSGAALKKDFLQQIVDVAAKHNIFVLSDETYRPLFHSLPSTDDDPPPSIVNMGYKNVVATGSLSKAFSLAGIRIGWLVSPNPDIIEWCAAVRHYTHITASQVDDQIATFALHPSTKDPLIARNLRLARNNIKIMEDWVNRHADVASWVKPQAATTAFVKIERDGKPVHAAWLCEKLYDVTGVMVLPGDTCFGDRFKGYIRIGYVQETRILESGLKLLGDFLNQELRKMPLADDPVQLHGYKLMNEPL